MQTAARHLEPRVFDVDLVRAQFPILSREVNGQPLVYLDNAASSQKPRRVLERMAVYYERENSNVHRGVHTLSQQATDAYEGAREHIRRFVNAESVEQIIYTRGCTEAINLVAATYGRKHVGTDDEIIVSALEHHSNIVPWQMLCEEKGARLRVLPVNERGEVELDRLAGLITDRTKLIAVAHVSNALGTIVPVEDIVRTAHERNVPVLIDGAQATPHLRVDMQEIGADFYCFSGHKMFGPTGIGVLYGRRELLAEMPPYQGGGDMIESVSFEKTTFNTLPHKFEAGTPHIAGAVGLGEAVAFLEEVDLPAAAAYEDELVHYATHRLLEIDRVRIIGTAEKKAGVVSFLVGDLHPYDVGTLLDHMGIAIRTGHHCAQPLMDQYGLPGAVRASFALYNTREDADRLAEGVRRAKSMLE
ncbi:MAG: SufS family cysteine desulfurase [Bacteroidota bacterium]